MAKVDVKCPFCKQIAPLKNMDWEAPDISVIAVRHAAEAFNLMMNTAPVSSASMHKLLTSPLITPVSGTPRALHISINAVVRTLKNSRRKA